MTLILRGLRRIREVRLMTMRELAAKSGVGTSTLVRIERHNHPARISTVRRLAEVLNCSVEELLGEPEQGQSEAAA